MFVWQHKKSAQLDLSLNWDLCKLDSCVKGLRRLHINYGRNNCWWWTSERRVWLNSWLNFDSALWPDGRRCLDQSCKICVFFFENDTCSDSKRDRRKTARREAQTLVTNKKCSRLLAGCREATVKAVSIIKAPGRRCWQRSNHYFFI